MRGSQPSQSGQGGQGGLGDLSDLLRQFTEKAQQGGQASPSRNQGSSDVGETSALDDLMRQFNQDREAPSRRDSSASQGGEQGFGIDDLLRQLNQAGEQNLGGHGGGSSQPSAPGAESGPGAGGSHGDILGQVFGQKPEGRGGADPKGGNGLQDGLRNIIEKMGGRGANANDIIGQLTTS
jgi:hypothetical protein